VRRWLDPLLHALGGAAIVAGAILIGIPAALALGVVSIGGWFREKLQHPPFSDPLSARQWVEALAWATGGLVAWLALALV